MGALFCLFVGVGGGVVVVVVELVADCRKAFIDVGVSSAAGPLHLADDTYGGL